MTSVKIGLSVFLLAALCLPGFWVLAGDDDDRARSSKAPTAAKAVPDAVRPDDRLTSIDARSDDDADDAASDERPGTDDDDDDIVFLGKTVKLTFTIVGEDEDRSYTVLCAARNFRISQEESGKDFQHSVVIAGQLHSMDAKGRIFLSFEVNTHHHDSNEDSEAVFASEGSVIVQFGKKVTLTNLGDQQLTATATVED